MKRKLSYLLCIFTLLTSILILFPSNLYADTITYTEGPFEMKIEPGYYNEVNTFTVKYSGTSAYAPDPAYPEDTFYFLVNYIENSIHTDILYSFGFLSYFPYNISHDAYVPEKPDYGFYYSNASNNGAIETWSHRIYFKLTQRPPSKPLTPEDLVLMDLNINQLLDLYGATPEGFIKMLYDIILNRVPDDKGLSDWVAALGNGMSPGEVAYYMVFSDELNLKISSMNSEEFISFLYNQVIDRKHDTEGYNSWVSFMADGNSKPDTLRAFLNNEEWFNICKLFNVAP